MHGGIWLALLVGAVLADYPVIHDYVGFQKGLHSHRPTQTYRSANITSPIFNYVTWRKDLIAGDQSSHIFLGLRYRDGGPYVLRDDDLSLVYADLNYQTAMNTRVQSVRGKDYLSFWHGAKTGSRGEGFCVFYDDQYQVKFNVTVHGEGFRADFHECQTTPDGNVILTAYEDKPHDLTPLGVPHFNVLADSCFQEVDIETNELKFSWCASDHYPPTITYQKYYRRKRDDVTTTTDVDNSDPNGTVPEGLDVYHINSIQKTHEGHYLVSLRAAKLIMYINGTSGEPIWNLGGKPNNFTDITARDILDANPHSDGALSFGWQHSARFIDDSLTEVIMFDNHNISTHTGCLDENCSRGRIVKIDTSDPKNLTVQLVRDYRSPQGLISQVMGSIQLVNSPNKKSPNVFIGWGSNSEFTEHTIDGTLARDIQFSPLDPRHAFNGMPGVNSYRIFKYQWHGYPTWAPSVAVDEDRKLYVSWNGATEVREWAVHGSYDSKDLGTINGSGYGFNPAHEPLMRRRPIHVVPRGGFETEIPIDYFWMPYVKLAALNFMGVVIGTSDLIEIQPPSGCGIECIGLQSILFP